MTSLIVLYAIVHNYNSYINFNLIFVKELFNVIASIIMVFIISYMNMINSKKSFLYKKKVITLLEEQFKIINELPDGAIIHKQVRSEDLSENKVMPH